MGEDPALWFLEDAKMKKKSMVRHTRLNPSLPNPGDSSGTWKSPPAMKDYTTYSLPSLSLIQATEGRGLLLIHQTQCGKEKHCRTSSVQSRAAQDKLARRYLRDALGAEKESPAHRQLTPPTWHRAELARDSILNVHGQRAVPTLYHRLP